MTIDDDKALVRRFIAEVFVACREEAVDELVADDFTGHTWGPEPADRAFLREAVGRMRAGLSEIAFDVQDMIREWLGALAWPAKVRVAVDVDPYSFV